MVSLNGYKYEYHGGLCLCDLICEYNLTRAKIDIKDCVIVVNGAAITETQAQDLALHDNDIVHIIPRLDGG